MEGSAQQTVVSPGPPRGGYRGRGGASLRGGFERGRGRGLGRGHYVGGGMGRGGLGGPGMMSSRGMRPPRGGSGGYQGRGGFTPRGSNGPSMRGGRPVLYPQPPKQHTGSENNKTVSPVPNVKVATAGSAAESGDTAEAVADSNNVIASTGGVVASGTHTVVHSNGTSSGPPSRPPRGRGGPLLRGGRGGYNTYSNGTHSTGLLGHGAEHGTMPLRRGGLLRGRGGYGQPMTRPPMQHSANTQIAPVPSLKRGVPGGPPGPKRGRYDHGPYSQRPMAPKYHQAPQHVQPMTQHQSYGPPQHHSQHASHHTYVNHDQAQSVDPYAQSYAAPAAQASYNGYGQSAYSAPVTAQAGGSYAHSTEYDQSQYQGYSTASYATQQDARYSTYGQDYTQQYGAPAVDYNSTAQADYSQHGQVYDERAYASYDSQSYQQNYSNAAGYY